MGAGEWSGVMARVGLVSEITPVAVPGATNATAGVTLTIDRLGVIYEDSAAETRGPYAAFYFRVNSSGGGAWTMPNPFGFRVRIDYRGDAQPTVLIQRRRSDGDNPWAGITIPGAGLTWLSVDTDGNGAMLDFDIERAAPNSAGAPVPGTSGTADVERHTLDSAKTPLRALFAVQSL